MAVLMDRPTKEVVDAHLCRCCSTSRELRASKRSIRSRCSCSPNGSRLLQALANRQPYSCMSGIFYCGDNLEILGKLRLVAPESVDLVYLDPPFNSQRTFNVVYKDSRAQAEAFVDHWSWEKTGASEYTKFMESSDVPPRLRTILQGFHDLMIDDDSGLITYIAMMAERLVALHGVLGPKGSLYLHCDPTASHYLKMVLDSIFGSANFRNEIIWKRSSAHNNSKGFGSVHDVLLYYSKGPKLTSNAVLTAHSAKYLKKFSKVDERTGLRFQDCDLCGPGTRTGESGKPWRGHDPTEKGRHWQPASYLYAKYKELTGDDLARHPFLERFDRLDDAGLIYWGSKGGLPRYKQFADDAEVVGLQDVWTDIDPVNSQAAERTPYPTQKPLALLERIISVSSNPGDLVLDPFCGCGTTIEACERMGRRWIGIDIARKAVEVTTERFLKLGVEPPEIKYASEYAWGHCDQLKASDSFEAIIDGDSWLRGHDTGAMFGCVEHELKDPT